MTIIGTMKMEYIVSIDRIDVDLPIENGVKILNRGLTRKNIGC